MEAFIALIALAVMEIVLGIDNIIFIAIVTDRLPEEQQPLARRCGLVAALVMRILLLLTLTWIMGLVAPLFELTSIGIPSGWLPEERFQAINEISWRDLILLGGGIFLIGKSADEIHDRFEHETEEANIKPPKSFRAVLVQIAILDIIFSLDSVITAVGMVDPSQLWVMITAVVIAVLVMMIFAERVSRFVRNHPSVKMLALSFLIMIGVMLVAEGLGQHINKGYIYFAMGFAITVEGLNLWAGNRDTPAEDAVTAISAENSTPSS